MCLYKSCPPVRWQLVALVIPRQIEISMPDFQDLLGVRQTGEHSFVSNHPLTKPHPDSHGVYGGNLAGQALLVALRTVPAGFTPHSLHSYFVKAVSDTKLVEWEVTEVSNGKNFCNRIVTAIQKGETRYVCNISLTRKNSVKQAEKEYRTYVEAEREKEKRRSESNNDDDDDDDDDDPVPPKPFHFLTPFPSWLKGVDKDRLEIDRRCELRMIYHKVTLQMVTLEGTKYEESIPASERVLSFFVRLGDDDVTITDPAFQFVGLAIISDSLFLTRLARLLRISTVNLNEMAHYYSVSLDHVIYFHDDDFDATKWMAYGFKALRCANNRVLLEAEMYNEAGLHVATVIQEGLVHFNGLEESAKL